MRAWIIDLAAAVSLAAPASLGQAAPASLGHNSTTSTTSTTSAATARFFVTGYVLQGYTATGTYVHPGTCAVDPRIIPLGSSITISGLGTCHAEDTGGAIIGYRIDVWVSTVAQADALTGWYTASWGPNPTQQAPGSQASKRQSPVPTSRRAPARQARSGRVLSQRWYSHGSAYVHRDARATARHILAQPTYSLLSLHGKGSHSAQVPGSQASRRQSPVPAPKRAPPHQARSGRVLSQRWYSHGNAYVHRATRATARHIAAQPSCSLLSHHRTDCHHPHRTDCPSHHRKGCHSVH